MRKRTKPQASAWASLKATVEQNPAISSDAKAAIIQEAEALVATYQRAAVPKGGNDVVMTPYDLAVAIVDHFQPTGYVCDPCAGTGNFLRAFELRMDTVPNSITLAQGFELTVGQDFLAMEPPPTFNWIITNPPWSKFTAFLKQAMRFADNVVFLDKMNAWGFTGRLRLIHDMPTPTNVLASLIERMVEVTDACPEALALMRMAAEAQRTGAMPDLSRLDMLRAGQHNLALTPP